MKQTLLSATIIFGLGLSTAYAQDKAISKTKKIEKMENKQKVVSLLKALETGAKEPLGYINPNKYIQHNLGVADGLAGLNALLQALPPNSTKVNTVRSFQDGNFVFTHNEYNFFGPKIGFDIFRFEDGKIDKIHRVLGEGNFVLVVSEGHFGKDHDAFYDLFRVENSKIAEHWDVIEPIPAKENWKNNNGKF